MADFFRGLAGGFQTGLQFGGAMRDKEERERLREAMQMTPQEMQQRQATPEELGRAQEETRGLAAQDAAMFGLSPQEQAQYAPQMPVEGQRIGATQYGLGGQTYNRMPTQQEIQQARYGAMADVIAERDPARAMEMRQRLEDQAYQAKRRPLELQGLQQQVEASDLTIAEKRRLAAEADKMTAFNTAYGDAAAKAAAEGRTLGARDIATLAQTHKLSPTQENELIAGHVGRSEAEVKQFRLDVEKVTQGKGFEQLVDLHKNDKRFGDGVHFVPEIDKKTGGVVLARVNEATGQVEERMPFKTKAEATAYLREEAVNPANAAIWLQNYKKAETGIRKDEAAIRASDAQAALAGPHGDVLRAQADYYKNRGNADKMGGTQYFTSQDGNMYASTPVFSPTGGLKFETTRVNPDNVKFQKPGVEGAGTKPVDVKEEGTKVTIGGQLRVADGLGNYIDPKGVLPNARPKVLKEANIPDNLAAELPWNQNGTAVGFGGKSYDVRNAADMKALKADYERLGKNTIAVEEAQRNIPRQQTGVRYDPYGASQRPRMGATQAEVDAFNAMRAREALSRQIGQSQVGLYNTSQYGLE